MSDETVDTHSLEAAPEHAEEEAEIPPLPDQPKDDETSDVKTSPESNTPKDVSSKASSEKHEETSREVEKPVEKSKETPIKKDKKLSYDFSNATEHILSRPSDLSEMVTSFENLQPIYGSEAVNFRNDESDDDPPVKDKDEKDKAAEVEDKSKKSSTEDKKGEEGSPGEDKKDEETYIKRDRRKSSILTEADLSRKSSEDPYPIGIPLKKKVNRSTRKKLWREIQRRKPFITDNVYAHIQHFAKPPFTTLGCNNFHFKKDTKSYSYEYWNV